MALIHAGRAIFHGLCSLHDYIPFFNQALDEFRNKRKHFYMPEDDEDDDGMGAFTTFDIIYSGLEARANRNDARAGTSHDAVELINTFAFFHHTDIRLDVLVKAGHNLVKAANQARPALQGLRAGASSKPFLHRLRDCANELNVYRQRHVSVYPRALRISPAQAFDEPRVRKAVALLVQMSLLSESSESGSYSMHALVHFWMRKRLGTAEQALWCGIACNVLASSIKIPPMTDEAGDQDLYVRMLPHIIEARSHQEEIRGRLALNFQKANYIRRTLNSGNPGTFDTLDALNAAKYSRVYMECFRFEDAVSLQQRVRDFVISLLGREHMGIVPITMILAKSLWYLARAAEAQELLEHALQVCKLNLGDDGSQTLQAMDALGETYWQRGRLKDAKILHEAAITGMQGRKELQRDRLKAMTHLGHVHEW